MWLHAFGGMPAHDVLRAATYCGASAMGHLKDLGTIEAGKLADLQLLNSNPLDDIRNTLDIAYVMKNGRLYDPKTVHEIGPEKPQ